TYVLVRYALLRVGEDDRLLADYLAAVVLAFGFRDRARRASENDDEIYDTLAALLRDAEDRDPRRSYVVRAHLGNYALWLSGLFPKNNSPERLMRQVRDETRYRWSQ